MEDTHVYLNKLSEELRLRKHSGQTEKVYTLIIRKFIESGLQPREFLLEYADKSRSSIRSVYFALKFFYENVLRQKFDETIPLAKNKGKLPVVLNKEEISKMLEATLNLKHRLVLMFLYYTGIRLNEIVNLKWEDIDFELDLLVSDAVENFDIYTKLGAKKIVFHIEAVGNLEEFKNFMEGIDTYMREMIEIGVAVNIDTPMEQVFPLISNVDFVQCMGINKVGFQEQEFDERVIENIKILKGKFPDLIISVDGGIDFNTAPALSSAGASRLVIGSAIFNTDDIIGTIEEFRNL